MSRQFEYVRCLGEGAFGKVFLISSTDAGKLSKVSLIFLAFCLQYILSVKKKSLFLGYENI